MERKMHTDRHRVVSLEGNWRCTQISNLNNGDYGDVNECKMKTCARKRVL